MEKVNCSFIMNTLKRVKISFCKIGYNGGAGNKIKLKKLQGQQI